MQPISPELQICAMLDGTIYKLLRPYVQDVERMDFRKLITVKRKDVIEFLCAQPARAKAYFEEHAKRNAVHDVETISRDGKEYMTAWMDNGRPTNIKRFQQLADAVAEHVLVSHGLY